MTTGVIAPQSDTYWARFEEISKYNVHLNLAERMWVAWYAYMQNDVLATGIMSFVMHELIYFGRSLPWIIADQLPWLRRYKIQNVSRPPLPPLLLLCFAALTVGADHDHSIKSPRRLNSGLAPDTF